MKELQLDVTITMIINLRVTARCNYNHDYKMKELQLDVTITMIINQRVTARCNYNHDYKSKGYS